ncbi:MAG: type II secretion system protein GspD [Marinicella sp.]
MNKFTPVLIIITFLQGCANMKDATIAHDYTNRAKDEVKSHFDAVKNYVNDDEKISLSLAEKPDENAFLNEPKSLLSVDLTYTTLVDILPSIIDREVVVSNDLYDPRDENDPNKTISINYQGSLSGLLNSICYKLKCSWSVTDAKSIYLSKYKTKFWRLPILPIDRSSQADISSESSYGETSGGGGAGPGEGNSVEGAAANSNLTGTSGQTVKSSFEYNAIDTVKSMIEPLISATEGSGESWSYSVQTGMLSVTASNEKLNSIDMALNELKNFLTAQVQFNIQLITYDESEDEGFGVDWGIVWERMGQLGISTNINSNVSSTADQLAFNVIEPDQPFTGTNAFINALSEFATISSRKEFNYSTLSNQVLPFNIAEKLPFQVITSTIVPDVGITQSYAIFEKSVGVQMNLVPVILSPDDLMVELYFSLSSLSETLEFDLGQFGSASIPQIKKRESLQQSMLKNGQTVVMTGFVLEDAQISKRSPIKAKAWMFGGSKNESRTKQSMVVVITPKIIF